MLHDGYGFPTSKEINITVAQHLRGTEVQWTLGLYLWCNFGNQFHLASFFSQLQTGVALALALQQTRGLSGNSLTAALLGEQPSATVSIPLSTWRHFIASVLFWVFIAAVVMAIAYFSWRRAMGPARRIVSLGDLRLLRP